MGGSLRSISTYGPRSIAYGDYQGGGRFIVVASAGGVGELAVASRDILVSSDGGASWQVASTVPSNCAIGVGQGDIVTGNGIFVIGDENGTTCRSRDGGQTWEVTATAQAELAASVKSGGNGVWTGSDFRFWGRNAANQRAMITSPDGTSWTSSEMTTQTRVGPVAVSPQGTFVTSVGQYATQQFLRSVDGLAWTTTATTSSVQSHAIHHVAFGYADPSTACPAP
jgi:hypothetical protein